MNTDEQIAEIRSELASVQREMREIRRKMINYEGGFSDLAELFKLTMVAIGKLAVAAAKGISPEDPILTKAHKALERLGKALPSISEDS